MALSDWYHRSRTFPIGGETLMTNPASKIFHCRSAIAGEVTAPAISVVEELHPGQQRQRRRIRLSGTATASPCCGWSPDAHRGETAEPAQNPPECRIRGGSMG